MHTISGCDPLIDRLITGRDAVTFHLISSLRRYESAVLMTDGQSCLAVQTSPAVPLWLYTNRPLTGTIARGMADHIARAFAANPRVRIHAVPGHLDEVLRILAAQHSYPLTRVGGLIAYVNERPTSPKLRGEMIAPTPDCAHVIAQLARDFTRTAEHHEMSDEEARLFAESKINAPDFFLWRDEGQIVAMAQIAHRSATHARINSVGTLTPFRGRGYAGMLVGTLCEKVLAEGLIPMLYADADYPSSNRAYQKIGFVQAGELMEYGLAQQS